MDVLVKRTVDVLDPILQSSRAAAKESGQSGIPKISLSAKRLARPPFRFLHKLITAVIRSTGAGKGLFSDAALDVCVDKRRLRERFDTRRKKVDFLERYIAFVNIAQGRAVTVRPSEIVAGINVEGTNMFLQDVAAVAQLPPSVLKKAVDEVVILDRMQRILLTQRQHAARAMQRIFKAWKLKKAEKRRRSEAASSIQRGWRHKQRRKRHRNQSSARPPSDASSSSSSYADDFDEYDDDDFESSGGDADVSSANIDGTEMRQEYTSNNVQKSERTKASGHDDESSRIRPLEGRHAGRSSTTPKAQQRQQQRLRLPKKMDEKEVGRRDRPWRTKMKRRPQSAGKENDAGAVQKRDQRRARKRQLYEKPWRENRHRHARGTDKQTTDGNKNKTRREKLDKGSHAEEILSPSPRGSIASVYSGKKRNRTVPSARYTEDPRVKVQSKVRSHPWLDYEWGQDNRLKSKRRGRQRKGHRRGVGAKQEITKQFANLHLPKLDDVENGKARAGRKRRGKLGRNSGRGAFRYNLVPVVQDINATKRKRRKKGNKIGSAMSVADAPLSSLPSIASRGELETIAARLQSNINQPSEESPIDDEAWTKYKQSTYWPGRDPGRSRQCRRGIPAEGIEISKGEQRDGLLQQENKRQAQAQAQQSNLGPLLPQINANLGRDAMFLSAGREETESARAKKKIAREKRARERMARKQSKVKATRVEKSRKRKPPVPRQKKRVRANRQSDNLHDDHEKWLKEFDRQFGDAVSVFEHESGTTAGKPVLSLPQTLVEEKNVTEEIMTSEITEEKELLGANQSLYDPNPENSDHGDVEKNMSDADKQSERLESHGDIGQNMADADKRAERQEIPDSFERRNDNKSQQDEESIHCEQVEQASEQVGTAVVKETVAERKKENGVLQKREESRGRRRVGGAFTKPGFASKKKSPKIKGTFATPSVVQRKELMQERQATVSRENTTRFKDELEHHNQKYARVQEQELQESELKQQALPVHTAESQEQERNLDLREKLKEEKLKKEKREQERCQQEEREQELMNTEQLRKELKQEGKQEEQKRFLKTKRQIYQEVEKKHEAQEMPCFAGFGFSSDEDGGSDDDNSDSDLSSPRGYTLTVREQQHAVVDEYDEEGFEEDSD